MYLYLYENTGSLSFIDILSKSKLKMLFFNVVPKRFLQYLNQSKIAFKTLMSSECLSKLQMNSFKVTSVGS